MLLVAKVVKKNEPTKRWPYFFSERLAGFR